MRQHGSDQLLTVQDLYNKDLLIALTFYLTLQCVGAGNNWIR